MRRKLWRVHNLTVEAKKLAEKFNIYPILAQILLNRNIEEAEFNGFLRSPLSALHAPHLLPDLDKAAARIHRAVKENERVLVFGDYDVDGITSLAVFHEFAKEFPGNFSFYIPHRIRDGYGLNADAIERAKQEGVSLIIAFDCGTNAFEELKLARSYGIDVVVVDHHQPKGGLPDAYAFVNPKRKDSCYPFCDLSSAALSFKLLQVLKKASCWGALDLVALSLVCDVVPLKGENRILLKEGIKWLKRSQRPSIKALCEVSGIRQHNVDTFHIGYILGPRINASGRVADAHHSLEIFLTEDEEKAYNIASKLQEYNQLRKGIEGLILREAEAQASQCSGECALVVHNEGWHPGVLGIVAARLVDRYYRPCFVISFENSVGRGSARSIHSLHLMEMLDECSDFLHTYGGHKKAAGIQIFKQELEGFKERLNTLVKSTLKPTDFVPIMDVDVKLEFTDITMMLVRELENLPPYGEGIGEPLFATYNVLKKGFPKKIKGGYSVWLQRDNKIFEGIIYDRDILEVVEYGTAFNIVYSLGKNTYHNVPKLIIRDCQLSDGGS
ncbi:MAG: single-stranded-DNA-specific exonuclease RecJ [Candidatus Omnitrophota bacterium]|nr:MAG: single-stranded-DNA-specific exonuclease RecJ [Candidatus Omnitrophota bacterium]